MRQVAFVLVLLGASTSAHGETAAETCQRVVVAAYDFAFDEATTRRAVELCVPAVRKATKGCKRGVTEREMCLVERGSAAAEPVIARLCASSGPDEHARTACALRLATLEHNEKQERILKEKLGTLEVATEAAQGLKDLGTSVSVGFMVRPKLPAELRPKSERICVAASDEELYERWFDAGVPFQHKSASSDGLAKCSFSFRSTVDKGIFRFQGIATCDPRCDGKKSYAYVAGEGTVRADTSHEKPNETLKVAAPTALAATPPPPL